jgi:hypothetical protein
MGWVQKVGNNHYYYEYRNGKNTYIGKCDDHGRMVELNPDVVDHGVEIGQQVGESAPQHLEEQNFYNMLMERLTEMTEKEKVEMIDIEHGEDYESMVAKQGEQYFLLMRPKEEQDFELLQKSIAQRESMHDLDELDVEDKTFIVVSSAKGDPDDEAEIIEGLKAEGREQGKHYHLVRMNRYLWGNEDDE